MTLRGWIFWAAALVGAAQPVSARPPGWYGSLSLGPGPIVGAGPQALTRGPVALQAHANGWSIFGGYQFNSELAAEAGYLGLGSAAGRPASGRAGLDTVEPEAFCMSGVGSMPVARNFWLLGRAGLCRWQGRYPASADNLGAPDRGFAGTGANVTYGVGGGYHVTPALGMHLDWQRYTNAVGGGNDVDLLSFGFSYRFR